MPTDASRRAYSLHGAQVIAHLAALEENGRPAVAALDGAVGVVPFIGPANGHGGAAASFDYCETAAPRQWLEIGEMRMCRRELQQDRLRQRTGAACRLRSRDLSRSNSLRLEIVRNRQIRIGFPHLFRRPDNGLPAQSKTHSRAELRVLRLRLRQLPHQDITIQFADRRLLEDVVRPANARRLGSWDEFDPEDRTLATPDPRSAPVRRRLPRQKAQSRQSP